MKRIVVLACVQAVSDEVYLKTRGGGRYMASISDRESRFIITIETYPGDQKLAYDATGLIERAVYITSRMPDVLVTDDLGGFKRGLKNAMRRNKKYCKKGQVPAHIHTTSVQKRHIQNNTHERQNGTTKDRAKTAREFNSDTPALLRLFVTYYNFVRPHMGLSGRTPAEAMGIRMEGDDKWATLMAFAASCC